MSSTERIESLTEEQIALQATVRDEWIAHGLSTRPVNREAAEAAMRDVYRAGGLTPPQRIVWASSPLALVLSDAAIRGGASVRDSVGASVWASVGASVRDSVGASVWASVRDSVGASVGASVNSFYESSWLAFFDYFRRIGILGIDPVAGLMRLHQSANWWIARTHVALICERPVALTRDAAGRLHNDDGMAIRWPDGWGVYSWHGVRVPAYVIEHHETLTAQAVLAERNQEVARAMRERMGARFFDELDAEVLHTDVDGARQPRRLLSVPVPESLTIDKRIVAVHVTCPSTGREYLLRVPPQTKRCDEAVAWTFGVESKDYAPVVER